MIKVEFGPFSYRLFWTFYFLPDHYDFRRKSSVNYFILIEFKQNELELLIYNVLHKISINIQSICESKHCFHQNKLDFYTFIAFLFILKLQTLTDIVRSLN